MSSEILLTTFLMVCLQFTSSQKIDGPEVFGYFENGQPIIHWLKHPLNDPGETVNIIPTTTTAVPKMWTPPGPAQGEGNYTDYYPYDQTAFLPFQNFSDITFYQLHVFEKAYNTILQNAAKAAGVGIEDGPKVFVKQAFYTLAVWHPSILKTFRLSSPEQFWTDSDVDNMMGTIAGSVHAQLLALSQNASGDVIIIADDTGFTHHRINLLSPHAKLNRITYQYLMDAELEAAHFFLGYEYTEEVYSALENVIYFVNALNWHYTDMYDVGCLKRLNTGVYETPNTI